MEENVLRGVALLDEKVPGWRERIQQDKLFMGDCFHCILGQLFGYYATGLQKLGKNTHDGFYYGFNTREEAYFIRLGKLWKEQL